jgi:hypothetical protein
VEELGGAGKAGASVVGHETADIGICQPERVERRPQLVLLAAGIDVDPQEALRPQRANDLGGQFDAAVLGIRIEQADGDVAQCR